MTIGSLDGLSIKMAISHPPTNPTLIGKAGRIRVLPLAIRRPISLSEPNAQFIFKRPAHEPL